MESNIVPKEVPETTLESNIVPNEVSENILLNQMDAMIKQAETLPAALDANLLDNPYYSMPISELATLGTGVASLLPALRTVTSTATTAGDNLYRVVNMAPGDGLKKYLSHYAPFTKNSKEMAILEEVGSTTATQTMTMPINPATMMMAVALYSIEQKLDEIEQTQAQILTFLETEKDSEIEADLQTLVSTIRDYKHNWTNAMVLQSSHKMMLDLKRTARKNMLFYKKTISDALRSKQLLPTQSKIQKSQRALEKKFQYYQISLYTFALASLAEILLNGNFEEAYISEIKEEIEKFNAEYRELFEQCSVYFEKNSASSLPSNVRNVTADASEAMSKFINSIPKVRDGQVDEYLQAKSDQLRLNDEKQTRSILIDFARFQNPGTIGITEKMEDIIQIYNRTNVICFDRDRIYLVQEQTA